MSTINAELTGIRLLIRETEDQVTLLNTELGDIQREEESYLDELGLLRLSKVVEEIEDSARVLPRDLREKALCTLEGFLGKLGEVSKRATGVPPVATPKSQASAPPSTGNSICSPETPGPKVQPNAPLVRVETTKPSGPRRLDLDELAHEEDDAPATAARGW